MLFFILFWCIKHIYIRTEINLLRLVVSDRQGPTTHPHAPTHAHTRTLCIEWINKEHWESVPRWNDVERVTVLQIFLFICRILNTRLYCTLRVSSSLYLLLCLLASTVSPSLPRYPSAMTFLTPSFPCTTVWFSTILHLFVVLCCLLVCFILFCYFFKFVISFHFLFHVFSECMCLRVCESVWCNYSVLLIVNVSYNCCLL